MGRASSAERSVRLEGPASCSNGIGTYEVSGAGTRRRSNTAAMVLNGMIDGIDFWRDDAADFYMNTTSQPSLSLIAKVWSTRSDQQDSANGGQASKNIDASKARSK